MHKLMEEDTEDLMNALRRAGRGDSEAFLKEHFDQGQPNFVCYMDSLFEDKGLKRQEVLLRAGLPQKYGYKLLTGESHTTDRDKLLRICFAMELSLKQAQRALKLYGMNELYPKNARDVMLIVALTRRQYDLNAVSRELTEQGFEPLMP